MHIRDEIEGVATIVRGLSFEQYSQSYVHRRAIERAVQIVSEAAKALPSEMLDRYPDPPWKAIIGIGNILRHEYQRLDDKLLWEIATMHLPAIERCLLNWIPERFGTRDST